ncbi:DoxX family protein [Streptosporangium sp. NPDC087985]|uniref:DoxX family protein n=1 Tax=Streptosporangium sp. NPDC087985 TaxID=3366196 RepID=UPI003816ABD2
MRQTLHDLATLAARLGVGGIFFANGWHKLEAGLTATGDQFATLGAPSPGVWAAATMLTELIGGTLLVAGLAVPACGLLLFVEAVAVSVVASGEPGLPLTGGDISLIVALGAASVLLAVSGAGRLSVDHMVVIKRREAEAAEDFAADTEADDVIAALHGPEAIAPAPASAPEEPVRPTGAEAPRGSESTEASESPADTAEPPAPGARPRSRRGAAKPPTPGKQGDTLVAGQKGTPAQD